MLDLLWNLLQLMPLANLACSMRTYLPPPCISSSLWTVLHQNTYYKFRSHNSNEQTELIPELLNNQPKCSTDNILSYIALGIITGCSVLGQRMLYNGPDVHISHTAFLVDGIGPQRGRRWLCYVRLLRTCHNNGDDEQYTIPRSGHPHRLHGCTWS